MAIVCVCEDVVTLVEAGGMVVRSKAFQPRESARGLGPADVARGLP